MPSRVLFRPQALNEVIETRDWYEVRREGLGEEFTAAVVQTVDRIRERPRAYQRVRGETRRAVLDRFPYSIYYRIAGDDIIVLAVQGRQHPRRWQSRE